MKEGNGYLVSWCVGHLVELAPPEAYDEKYEKWRYSDLPILPSEWKYQISDATRLFSTLYGQTLNVGRVMTLTLAMIVQREAEIESFKPEPIYRLSISCGGITAVSDRLEKKEDAENILKVLRYAEGCACGNIEGSDAKIG